MTGKNDHQITIRVTTKASTNRIVECNEDGDGTGPDFRVYVTTVPENGKANKDVVKLLAKYLGVPKSSLSISKGATSRDKTLVISKE